MGTMRPIEDRVFAKAEISEDHWIWTGGKVSGGYGSITRGRRSEGRIRVHVWSYQTFVGPIPEGMKVLHKCDIPACFRPECLFLGTDADNQQDMIEKGRGWWQQGKCRNDHEQNAENTYVDGRGIKACRVCRREARRKRKERDGRWT